MNFFYCSFKLIENHFHLVHRQWFILLDFHLPAVLMKIGACVNNPENLIRKREKFLQRDENTCIKSVFCFFEILQIFLFICWQQVRGWNEVEDLHQQQQQNVWGFKHQMVTVLILFCFKLSMFLFSFVPIQSSEKLFRHGLWSISRGVKEDVLPNEIQDFVSVAVALTYTVCFSLSRGM